MLNKKQLTEMRHISSTTIDVLFGFHVFLICIEHNQTFWLFKQMLACFFSEPCRTTPEPTSAMFSKHVMFFLIYLRFPGPCWFLKYDVPILQQRIHVQYRCYSEGNWTVRETKFSNVEDCSGSTSQDFNQDVNFKQFDEQLVQTMWKLTCESN